MIISRDIGSVNLKMFEGLKSKIAFTDFCEPAGTIEFNAYEGFLLNKILLFSFRYENYVFEASIRDGMVFVRRNNVYQHSEQVLDKNGYCKVAIQWDVGSISCGVIGPNATGEMNQHMRAVRTPITTPPAEIVSILRRNNLLSNQQYNSIDDLFITLIDSISLSNEDIRRYGGEKQRWKLCSQKRT